MNDLTEVVASAVVVFVVGFLLWPPRHVYWTAVTAVVGSLLTVITIFGICLAIGLAVGRFTAVAPRNFAVGGFVAYLIGMYLIEETMTTDSPVHFLLYGGMLLCMVAGTVAGPSYELLTAALDRAADHSDA